ncbi:D-alanyl-D-alanine dipeptidase [Mycobacterium sp. EPG1]|nr:D-alanyl-D-alanine dipeptidase [Mycobacterium sp. EPG1]
MPFLLKAAAVAAAVFLATVATGPGAAAQPEPTAPPEFVSLSDVDSTILMDIRYATPHNFTGEPVDGYQAPMCILTRPAAEALHRAQQGFLAEGYSLKIYDCYRPQRAVNEFVTWAADLTDQRMKAEFYPRVDKSRLFDDGYIADKSGHSRGDTVDLTLVRLPAASTAPYEPGQPLVDCAAPQPERFPDNSIDMGTGYDCFDTLSHTLDPRVQGEQLKNRLLLKDGLERQGLQNYEYEWWHFTFKPETFPDTYFDFPVAPTSLSD